MNPSFTLWIDADACPRELRDIVELAALRRKIPAVFVANSYLALHPSEYITLVQVPKGGDKADDHIVENAAPHDLAITADIPLAARLLEKKVEVINTAGEQITPATIGDRLATRNLMEELRGANLIQGGPPPPTPTTTRHFANALDRALTRLTR